MQTLGEDGSTDLEHCAVQVADVVRARPDQTLLQKSGQVNEANSCGERRHLFVLAVSIASVDVVTYRTFAWIDSNSNAYITCMPQLQGPNQTQ